VPHGAEADEGAKPGGEGAAAVLVAGHLLQGGHEDLGGDVVHVGGKVAEQAIQDTVDEVAMPAVELTERLAVAGHSALDHAGLVEAGEVGGGRRCGGTRRRQNRYAQLDPPMGLCCRAGALEGRWPRWLAEVRGRVGALPRADLQIGR